jgi:hypothetical protein
MYARARPRTQQLPTCCAQERDGKLKMSDPYREFFRRLLWVAVIYLGVMAEVGFLKGTGVL